MVIKAYFFIGIVCGMNMLLGKRSRQKRVFVCFVDRANLWTGSTCRKKTGMMRIIEAAHAFAFMSRGAATVAGGCFALLFQRIRQSCLSKAASRRKCLFRLSTRR